MQAGSISRRTFMWLTALAALGTLAEAAEPPGRAGSWGIDTHSNTYTPPAWRTIECVEMDDSLKKFCGSLRSTYARPVVRVESLTTSTDAYLYNASKPHVADTSARRAEHIHRLVQLAGLAREGDSECKRRGMGFLCNYMAPECGETPPLQFPNGTEMRHPITGRVTESVRRSTCYGACDDYMRMCPDFAKYLEVLGIRGACHSFTYGDIEFDKRWSSNRFLGFQEHFESYQYPANSTTHSVNLTKQYITLSEGSKIIDSTTTEGWGRHEWYFNDIQKLEAWRDNRDTPWSSQRIFSLDSDAGVAAMQHQHDRFFRSVDGQKHVVTCQAIKPVADYAGIKCPSSLTADLETATCVVGCPTPVFTTSQQDSLQALSTAVGVFAVLGGLLIAGIIGVNKRRRVFPTRISAYFGACLFLFGVARCLRPQPCDSSLQQRSGGAVCELQAWLLVFGQVGMSLWWSVLAVILAASVRIRTSHVMELLRTRECWLHALCWLTALLCATLPVALGKVAHNAGSTTCGIATTEGSVALLVVLLIAPQSVAIFVSAVAAFLTVKTVWYQEYTSQSTHSVSATSDVKPKKNRKQFRTVLRWAMFVPLYLVALLMSLWTEIQRLNAATSLNEAVRGASECVLRLYEAACDRTGSYCDRSAVSLSEEDTNACIENELRRHLFSFETEVGALVAWICVALLAAGIFTASLRCCHCRRFAQTLAGSTTKSTAVVEMGQHDAREAGQPTSVTVTSTDST